jgi:alanine dehydrogenase
MRYLDDIFDGGITTLYSNRKNITDCLAETDLLVGAVLVTGASAPKLVKKEDLKLMKPGSVIVDVAVDQGGCVETTRPTTHDDPVFTIDGVIHYCVSNMPGAVPVTSTIALVDQTLRYGLEIANKGLARAAAENSALRLGINTCNGYITHPAVAKSLGMEYKEFTP